MMQIERKTIAAMIVLEAESPMTLMQIPAYAERIIPDLLAEADARGMAITGPCTFMYEGCDGKLETTFTLRVGFPVDACAGQGQFACREIPTHDCLFVRYHGGMEGIGAAWSRFSVLAVESGLTLQPVGREVYEYWVGHSSPDNITELQIPLQD